MREAILRKAHGKLAERGRPAPPRSAWNVMAFRHCNLSVHMRAVPGATPSASNAIAMKRRRDSSLAHVSQSTERP
jgi:hypothetical protein